MLCTGNRLWRVDRRLPSSRLHQSRPQRPGVSVSNTLRGLRENLFDDGSVHVRQPEVAALKFVRQPGVIDAQAVQDGSLYVMNVNGLFGHVIRVVVGGTVSQTRPHAATCHPHSETSRVVIAAIIILRQASLAVDCPPKLSAPDDERVIQQAALLQILDERRGGLIGFEASLRQSYGQLAVMIPVAMIELYESDSALGKSPRKEAVVRALQSRHHLHPAEAFSRSDRRIPGDAAARSVA